MNFLSSLASSFMPPPAPPPSSASPPAAFPLLDLPQPALAAIATFLPFPSALALSHTCTELRELNAWVEIAQAAGLPPVPSDLRSNSRASLRHVVVESRKRGARVETHFEIAWGGDDRYWRRGVPVEGGEYFSAAILRHVWWFDLTVALELRGTHPHFVFFRVKKLNAPYGFGELQCDVTVTGHENVGSVSTSVPRERLSTRRLPNSEWVWVFVGSVELTARATAAAALPSAVVKASLRDHDSTMKSDAAFSHAICVRGDLMTRTQLEAFRAVGALQTRVVGV